jgi:hypothetical protein
MTDFITYSDEGVTILTENEIYEEIVNKCLEIDPNFNTDPSTFDGYMNAYHAQNYRQICEAFVEAWNSKDPAKARDTQLNIIGSLTGASREDGTYSQIVGTCTGTPGTIITLGAVVSGDQSWTIDNAYTIGDDGTVEVTATCTVQGSVEPDDGTVTSIDTVIGGWTSFTNTGVNVTGQDSQSNASFRVTRSKGVSIASSNQMDSITSKLYALDDVSKVAPYENSTSSEDVSTDNPYGLPAHSATFIVEGGAVADIAQVLYDNKNPGVYFNGGTNPVEYEVTSDVHTSNSMTIRFGRPDYVDIDLQVELADPSDSLPSNIQELVRDAVVSFASGDLIDEDQGFDSDGFDIGEDVPVRKLDTPINQVVGQYSGAYISATTLNGLSTGVLSMDYNQIGSWVSDAITVTLV